MKTKILCYTIGIIFLLSGIGKVSNIAGFQYHIIQYGFPCFNILAPLIALLEILLGSCFLLNIKIKQVSFLSMISLFIFSVIYLYGYITYDIHDCGCFGDIIKISSPSYVIVRNIVLIIICSYLFFLNKKESNYNNWKKKIILTIMFPSVFLAGATFRYIPTRQKQHELQNKKISETVLVDLITEDNKNKLICFFSYSCPHCWNSIAQLDSYISTELIDTISIYMVTDGDKEAKEIFLEYYPNLQYKEINKDSLHGRINAFPTILFSKHDTINHIFCGTLPSAYVWKTYIIQQTKK